MPGRTLTPIDCYALINAIYKEITGQEGTIQAEDTSSFVSVGESILKAGTENTLNALGLVLGRTLVAVRPYQAKLSILNPLNSGLYSNRLRKISYYSRMAEPSGAFNTNLYTNHAMGYDNGSNSGNSLATMWEQNQPVPLEMNFGGRSVWDDSTTIYEDQLQAAFRDEASFARFMEGIMTEKGNDIETEKEAFNRATLLNYVAGIYDLDPTGRAFDLAREYNVAMGTTHTRSDLLSTYYESFLKFVVAFIKIKSAQMENRSAKWHLSPAKTINGVSYELLRHTPKSKQRLIMYKPFWIDAEAQVLPTVFNDQYLKPEQYEGVMFWQNELNPESVSIVPAIPDVNDLTTQTAGTKVDYDYLLGVLYDEDAIMVDYQLDSSYSTPVEARKRFRNIWWHFAKNAINDFTENGIVFYIGAGGNPNP
jgi:hypothetical protein